MAWTPIPRADLDLLGLPLDAQQGYLLSRLDGATDVTGLAQVMGLPSEQIEALLGDLVAMGVVSPVASAEQTVRRPDDPESETDAEAETPESGEADGADRETPAEAARTTTHRQLFETSLHALSLDVRVARARSAEEPELSAFCFDPMPGVIQALLENPRTGLDQARLVARHHRTPAGLEAVAARVAFANDAGVRRGLLQNPQLPTGLLRRLWAARRLAELYLLATSRDAPEQTRHGARDLLRSAFVQRVGEERVELILNTEGRCLALLAGLTVDGKTTALLCRRTYVSTLLIQNLARWSAAPPQLIAHLRKQDAVRRNAQLRIMLERHPNAG